MSADVRVDVEDGVAWLTVDRPAVRNALSSAVCAELAASLRTLSADPRVRVFVLRGAGDRVFISGADIGEFGSALASPESALAYDAGAERLQSAIKSVSQPVIAMINGHAIGSGCIVAVACDFRLAATSARFGIPVPRFGFIAPLPDVLRLAQLVGPSKAKWILMTGRLFDADSALAMGLVDEIHAPESLLAETRAFAASLADNAPLSMKVTKEMIEHCMGPSPDVYRAAPWYREVFGSDDLREGLDAYFAKRKPAFHGK